MRVAHPAASLFLLCTLYATLTRTDNVPHGKQATVTRSGGEATQTREYRMPGAKPRTEDAYLCTAFPMSAKDEYIVNYEALTTVKVTHHMLLYGCERPLGQTGVWRCGSICASGSPFVMWAWAQNAKPTNLPKDVGFHMGGSSKVKYLVLQVHYKHRLQSGMEPDKSGVKLTISSKRQKYLAGIYLLLSYWATIPARTKKVHSDISCKYHGETNLYPFAFRVHAHTLGRVITGYQNNGSWSLIGKGNPQWPQAFYPVEDKFTIKPGDFMVGRCTYDSSGRDRNTHIGGTHNDEMCNFYMMYYTDASKGKPYFFCGGNNYPRLVASIPPGSDVPLPRNPLLEEVAKGLTPPPHPHVESHMQGNRDNVYPSYLASNKYYNNAPNDYNYYYNNDDNDNDNRDYFYYEVANQRNRNRGPQQPPLYQTDNSGYSERKSFVRPGSYGGRGGGNISPNNRNSYIQGRNGMDRAQVVNNGNASPTSTNSVEEGSNNGKTRIPNRIGGSNGIVGRRKGGRSGIKGRIDGDSGGIDGRKAHAESMPRPKGLIHHGDRQRNSGGGQISRQSPVAPKKPAPSAHNKEHINEETSGTPLLSSVTAQPGWPKTPNELGQVAGVATDSKKNIYIFHRGSHVWDGGAFDLLNKYRRVSAGPIAKDTVIIYNKNGEVIDSWGSNMFYMPHGLHIDREDNVWVTDVALHQVFKFKAGEFKKPVLTLGQKFVPGSGKDHFCKPTDVAVLKNGNFYVSDGYCNHRVMKFSKEGDLIKEWGKATNSIMGKGAGFPPPVAFDIPHSVTVAEDKNLVCVADRENGRIQCFDLDGNFKHQMHPKEFNGRLFAVSYCHKNRVLYAVNGPSLYKGKSKCSGFTLDIDTGTLLEIWQPPKGFSNPHDVTGSPDGEAIYVGEIGPNKIWKMNVDRRKLPGNVILHSEKKASISHPDSVASGPDTMQSKKVGMPESADFGASMIIGGLLIVPVLVIIIITVFIRLKKSGKHRGYEKAPVIYDVVD